MADTAHAGARLHRSLHPILAGAAVVAAVVFAASLFGILTRPIGSLAAIWPANALLLGLMVRNPAVAGPAGWMAAFAGFVFADLATGSTLAVTLWLSIANLTGALTGWLLFRTMEDEGRSLRSPISVLYMFGVCVIASFVAAIAGGGAAKLVFGRDFLAGLEFWFITELVNYLVLLPAMLAFPSLRLRSRPRTASSLTVSGKQVLPAAALLTTILASMIIGGPGAITFTVPALIWCALSYSVFTTAILTSLSSAWLLVAIPAGLIVMPLPADPMSAAVSIRLGISLTALGPLTIASISAAREELIRQLAHSANHDPLTGALSRRAFFTGATRTLAEDGRACRDTSVIMLDIDHFKQVNDRHGHGCGDAVLAGFASFISGRLRPGDVFGRLGGEEFAIVMPATPLGEALGIVERIRSELAATVLVRQEAEAEAIELTVTVSAGITATALAPGRSIDGLLAMADKALYDAKRSGRNRIVVGGGADDAGHGIVRRRKDWSG